MISLLSAAFASWLLVLAPGAAQAATPWQVEGVHRDHGSGSGEPGFEGVVTFGDSLSDPGNAFVATGDFVVRPFDPIPDAPYLIGGFRFSNGPTWIEWLTRDLGLRRSGRPALLLPGIYTNYAVGAARARTEGPVDLATEIDLFLKDFDGDAPPDMLYVLWIGSNDLRDALAALEDDPTGGATVAIITEAVEATKNGIIDLVVAGADSFLVLNLPNVAITPAINTQDPDVQFFAEFFSEQYNAGLELVLLGLEARLGITIARLDVFAILNDAVADPASVGLINVTDSCITPGVIIGAVCRRPNTYLFWDFIHPTTQAHRLLSEEAEGSLEATFDGVAPAAPLVSAR